MKGDQEENTGQPTAVRKGVQDFVALGAADR